MSTLGISSDPHVQFLSQVLDEIVAGNLQIPKFQRPYLWDWERRLELLRSIRLGIPMGAIMVWRTTESHLRTYNQFGNLKFRDPLPHGPQQYVLDGVQRLSTLVVALVNPVTDPDAGGDNLYSIVEYERRAYFDLVDDDFIAIDPDKIDPSRHLPLDVLMHSLGLLKFQRSLVGAMSEQYIRTSDALSRSFREYKIPVIPIVSDDLSLASQTFQRINSSGLQMGEKDMLHALTFTADFDLSERIDSMRESLRAIGWGSLDDDLMLKLIKAGLGLDVYRADVAVVSEKLGAAEHFLDSLEECLYKAALFLKSECGMPTPEFVPYGMQIIGLAEAFRVAGLNLSESSKHILQKWVWITTYTEYFTGLSGDKVNGQIDLVRTLVKADGNNKFAAAFPTSPMFQSKTRFDFRTARSKAFAVALARNADDCLKAEGFKSLEKYGRDGVVAGFARSDFKDSRFYLSPGNKFLVNPTMLKEFREQLYGVDSATSAFALRHAITAEALSDLRNHDYDSFVRKRNSDVSILEGQFLKNLTS